MAQKYYLYQDEHDGHGWFRPFGTKKMYKHEAQAYIDGQHYARILDINELGYWYPEHNFKLVEVDE